MAFALVFAGCGAVVTDGLRDVALGTLGVAAVLGLTIMVMIYATGHLSGAHSNRVVTVALTLTRQFPPREVALHRRPARRRRRRRDAAARNLGPRPPAALGATVPSVDAITALLYEVVLTAVAQGVQVTAPANPLRGISIDSAYIAGVLEETPGPIVAVGHSYGGDDHQCREAGENVVGLVYVAAFATEEGERLADAEAASKDSVLNSALVPLDYPAANGG
ncbi:MAG TPA: aquaporin, partial [Solirubrobacteraceae bacterium]